MKIIITGNIGSGKTTILKQLNQQFQFEEIIIDDFRVKFGDGNLEGELSARENFYKSIKKNANQIIECTGVGSVAAKLFEILNKFNEPIILLVLAVSNENCLSRITKRDLVVPFPFKSEPLYSKLLRFEKKLNSNTILQGYPQKENKITIYRRNESLEDINSIIIEMISLIKKINSILYNE